jgi:hypothetical protein
MNHIPGIFSEKSEEFRLKEYECLRREIEMTSKDSRSLEKYIAVAVGGIWTWLYGVKVNSPWMWSVPCLLAILGAIRAFGMNQSFVVFHAYILKLEEAFSKTGGPEGWEHFIEKHDTGNAKGAVLFWAILITSTAAAAILRSRNLI